MGITGERLHALEAHNLIVCWLYRHDKDPSGWKRPNVLTLGI